MMSNEFPNAPNVLEKGASTKKFSSSKQIHPAAWVAPPLSQLRAEHHALRPTLRPASSAPRAQPAPTPHVM
jgi:hypothetical protein